MGSNLGCLLQSFQLYVVKFYIFLLLTKEIITDYGHMMTRFQIFYSHIPISNRKSCKMYENFSVLPKKWLCNAKSRTWDKQCQKPNRPKYVGIKKKNSHWVSVVLGNTHTCFHLLILLCTLMLRQYLSKNS